MTIVNYDAATDSFLPSDKLHSIEGGKPSDEKTAEYYRQRLKPMLDQIALVMNEARGDGFWVEFGIPSDNFGRYVPTAITLVKRY